MFHESENIKSKISSDCDQLVRELEIEMKNMNNNLIKRGDKQVKATTTVKTVANYNKEVFYINKVKMVQLNDVKFSNDFAGVQEKVDGVPTQSNSNNNQDYFDSLIKLIENAAKNLEN